MTRRFAWFTVGLTACVSFLVGMVVTGTLTPTTGDLGAVGRGGAGARRSAVHAGHRRRRQLR